MYLELQKYFTSLIDRELNITLHDITFDTPPKKNMGDLTFSCFTLAKELKKSPIDISNLLSEAINNDENKFQDIEKVSATGPYLNIYFNEESIALSFEKFIQNNSLYGEVSKNKNTHIYIDYIGANVGKPLHIGHMCTPNQGQVFINLFNKLGYTVISDSHIGDWGIIFGKLIVAFEKYGDEVALKEDAVEHLFQLYVKISNDSETDASLDQQFRDAFKKLSQGDTKMVDNWTRFTKFSIQKMDELLARFGVFPQYDIGESFYEGLGLPKMQDYPDLITPMHEIVRELISMNIATKNEDGSVGIVFPDELKLPSCILQKRDGTHGYLASDLASIKYRMQNWNPSKIIYFVDVRQQLHFKQAFAISRLAGWLKEETEITHAHNGFVSLKDGAMSTRKGKIIKLEKLLDEGESKAKEIILQKRDDISEEKITELQKIISLGAIKYGYLKKSREIDVIFDWDEFMTFDGNSGPYIQYAYVRGKKVLEKSKIVGVSQNLVYSESEEKDLIKKILDYPSIVLKSAETYHAHIICIYLFELTKLFSSFYANVQVIDDSLESSVKNSRLVLVSQFLKIIEEGFEILAIPLPDEM
ncbi:arginine--tRNA ligase [Candidatus Gracilibacteria bacterium]|nr:arginine--tRNA ligase [Candidatus Gracilibacteria bacterium]